MKEILKQAFIKTLPVMAGIIVVLLHIWKKNTLLSIVSGTIVYMLLIQFIFI